ncbi:MAG: DUF1156 domain-containing protein [Firmicutes bacterium]|nr:DUF1156 domain-containing protein [Bacillota bacterium]
MTQHQRKLIEVALPLPEINDASAYDKMPGIGPHPKGIHHWWARLPLPTARAILFASVVDDPSAHPDRFATEEAQNAERERLFGIIRRMMQKQLHRHPEVYAEARAEMLKHCGGRLPAILDPFAGGGSIPLEAARLGFKAYAGDLNPIAVLLNKCNLELVPRWAGRPPVNPEDRQKIGGTDSWPGASGLAADVRYYGRVVLGRAREKIGHLYPPVKVTKEMAEDRPDLKPYVGKELPVIAWIWARTVASPNPAARRAHVPLLSTFWLSSKKGSEAWLEPIVDRTTGIWRFAVRIGPPKDRAAVKAGTKSGTGGFRCLVSDSPIPFDYIRAEGERRRLGFAMVAIVAQLPRGRAYLPVSDEQVKAAASVSPSDFPDSDLPAEALGFRIQNYGITKHWQMFTPRQLTAVVTLSDLVKAIREDVRRDAGAAGLSDEDAEAYAAMVVTFLALNLNRCADLGNSLCTWNHCDQVLRNLFKRQAIPMVWDFAEANILEGVVGGWSTCIERTARSIETMSTRRAGHARQIDAASPWNGLRNVLVSTDPPYYDNIGYAALSDFFYVWLRRTVGDLYPDLFKTILVPKEPELVAAPERFSGDKYKAKEHFESGFRKAFVALREKMDPRFPLTVYYAFKQDDEESGAGEEEADASNGLTIDRTTGWETMLESLIGTGFQITATWPVRASQAWRMRAMRSNALASYSVFACRPRPADAPQTDRRSFVAELKRELPAALRRLRQGNIAPVDFAQAAIGPGMAIYSRYRRILESSGRPMTVRTALALINQTLTEVLSEQEDEFDADTRWALAWFEQLGFAEGEFGVAETLSKAKNTSVSGMVQAGILSSKGGKVRLLRPDELPKEWDPVADLRLTVWEMVHHLIRALEAGGEGAAAELVRKFGSKAEMARDLAYRLYTICERKKRAQEALSYNGLVQSWPEITRLAREGSESGQAQRSLFEESGE